MSPHSPVDTGYSPPVPALYVLRSRMDAIDTQLVALLSRRCKLQREICDYKRQHGLPLHDRLREQEILAHCISLAEGFDVPDDIVLRLYAGLFELARGEISAGTGKPPA